MNADRATYIDSSAIVKLAIAEEDSAALRRYVVQRRLVSSAVARTEVGRALLPKGVRAVARGVDVLAVIELVAVSRRVLEGAVEPLPVELRSLDAIHLATAQLLGDDLARLVTYDERMASAARSFGWTVLSPS